MTEPKYALIVINWRTPQLTTAALRSAQKMAADPASLRFIIIDNHSGDDSLAIFANELPEAEVHEMPGNLGFAKAVNAGLALVREPYAFILNSDIEFLNDAISILADRLDGDPKAVLACPKLLRPNGSMQAAAVPEPKIHWELTNRSLPRHLMTIHENEPTVVPGVVGPCMAVHMARVQDVGFLDERFFFFFEETDWCKRISDRGQHVLFVPAAEIIHLQGESANKRPVQARIQFYLSRYKYFRKHNGALGVGILYLGISLRLTLNLLIHSLLVLLTFGKARHRDRVIVYAHLWVWHLRLCQPKWAFE
ncbi:MAG: N-acetylglucosaminyl-diphospho-decaprenol L-rhamnosyltransferase [Rhodothermales bacterium]|jgi:N-acetylglucosaminyl-diphospho-decaprenol L-rhamnosyltransferase